MNGLDKAALDRWITREQPDPDDERYADQESLDDHYGPNGPENVPDWWEIA